MTDQNGSGTRVVKVPFYWLVVGVVTCLVSPVLAVLISVYVNNRTIEATERQRTAAVAEAERQQAAQRAESQRVVCALSTTQLNAFEDAASDVGKASYRGWLDLYRLSKCQPLR